MIPVSVTLIVFGGVNRLLVTQLLIFLFYVCYCCSVCRRLLCFLNIASWLRLLGYLGQHSQRSMVVQTCSPTVKVLPVLAVILKAPG